MDAVLQSALSAPSLRTFHAIKIDLPSTGTSIHLIDGSGTVRFAIDGTMTTLTGLDPVFGTVGGIDTIAEQIASEAPGVSISLLPPSSAALGELNAIENQGAPVRLWTGLVDEMSGAVIGVELLWSGRLDTVVTNVSPNMQSCELVTVSAYDRLFAVNEGEALNKTWHQARWPGETGLDFNVDSTVEIFWGGEAGKPSTTPIPTSGLAPLRPNAWGALR